MEAKSTVDFGLRSDDYARHRPGFPPSFYDRIERVFPINNTKVLDLGTGPGTVALALAAREASVLGIDVSPPQIDAARKHAEQLGLAARASFKVGRAEHTNLAPASVDVVTAGQCWVWFDQTAALAEIERILKPGGHLVVAHYCYLPTRSYIAARTEELILRYNPGWTMANFNGVYAKHIDSLQTKGLKLVEQFCYDYDQPFTHEAWRGRMRTCNGVGAGGMSDQDVARFDADLAGFLAAEFPLEPITIEHRVWTVVCRRVQ